MQSAEPLVPTLYGAMTGASSARQELQFSAALSVGHPSLSVARVTFSLSLSSCKAQLLRPDGQGERLGCRERQHHRTHQTGADIPALSPPRFPERP